MSTIGDNSVLSHIYGSTEAARVQNLFKHTTLPKWRGEGHFPTPLEVRPDISQDLGIKLLLKREDTIADLGYGHKARKLGFIVSDALQQEATVLITGGSLPSSQCVAVAAVAKRHGLRAHLIYSGDRQVRPTHLQGNYLLATLLGPSITWYETTPWTESAACIKAITRIEEENGEKPYIISPGASTWPGLLGSIDLGLELAEQLVGQSSDVTYVVAPAGSGGTCLGLSIAARLLGLAWHVMGVCIGGTKTGIENQTVALLEEAVRAVGCPDIRGVKVCYDDGSLGNGYDEPRPMELETMREVLLRYHLLFDPNYMLKTFLGLRQLVERGTIPEGAQVVLVHTGGNLGIFGETPLLQKWYREQLKMYLTK